MNQPSPALTLLSRVQRRLTIVKLARSLHVSLIIAVAMGCLIVLVVRLGGLLPPNRQHIEYYLPGLPLAAAVIAWIVSRKADTSAAARVVDRHARTDDLFLTFATLSSSAGDYQPLVQQSAVQAAERIQPDQVVPYRPNRPIGIQAVVLTAFALLLWFLPTFDPFGRVEAATRVERQKTQLQLTVESIRRREQKVSQQLKQAEQRAGEIERKAEEMMTALRKMKPNEKRPTRRCSGNSSSSSISFGTAFPATVSGKCSQKTVWKCSPANNPEK